MINELKKLCLLNGISGDESSVRQYILSRISDKADVSVDPLGNVIAFVKGKNKSDKKVLVSAHMDEVGFIVTYINEDGSIKLAPVGGIDPRVVFGKRLVTDSGIMGVVCSAPVHLVSKDDRLKTVPLDRLTVEIGTQNREETLKYVHIGESFNFVSDFVKFGDGLVKCKAIDDRAGCAIILRLIDEAPEYDTWFTFVVQEEIGLRGSACAAYTVAPDYAIVLEATTASDIPPAVDEKKVCTVGKGPVVSFMDRHTMYDKELYELAFETANKLNIPCQTKTVVTGGNDAGAIQIAHGGVRTAAISLPCRYLHSPSCVISEKDFENAYVLTKNLLDRIHQK